MVDFNGQFAGDRNEFLHLGASNFVTDPEWKFRAQEKPIRRDMIPSGKL